MESNEKKLSPEESLSLIQAMIATAKNKVSENGFHLLLWGVLVISCCLINYLFIKMNLGNWAGIVWLIMPFIGVPAGSLYERGRKEKGLVKTHYDIHISYMWLSYLFSLIVVIVFCSFSQISAVPFILIITGMVTFATGKIIQFTPLLIGGVIFWLSALVCIEIKSEEQLLIQAGSILIGYIVPGVLLWRKSKATQYV